MISKTILKFLRNLKQNNCKEWFDANKSRYEEAKKEFDHFISYLIPQIAKFDKDISGRKKKSLRRILCAYRTGRKFSCRRNLHAGTKNFKSRT